MADERSKYFCILPHSHLNLTARGHTIACCNYNWRTSPVLGKEIDGSLVPKHQDLPITEIFNEHEEWKQLRYNSLNNIPSPGCKNCYMYEKNGAFSHRMWANEHFKDIKVTKDNHTLKSFELKLGAKCNLACRSCSSQSSNKLLKEDSLLMFETLDKDWIRKRQLGSDWIHDETFWNGLHDVSHDLEYIQFTGGEPLLIQEHYDYLRWLIKNNIRPSISYVTNATIRLTDEIRQLWNEFPSINISFSIDAIGKLGEYMRTGSVWEEQQRNIREYIDYFNERNELPGISNRCSIATTVSILNVYSMGLMIDYLKSFNDPNILDTWAVNMVTSPKWLSVANIPTDIKPIIKHRLNKVINTSDISERAYSNLNLIINSMDTVLNDKEVIHENGKFVDRLKLQERNYFLANKKMMNYKKIEPEWWKLLTEGKNAN